MPQFVRNKVCDCRLRVLHYEFSCDTNEVHVIINRHICTANNYLLKLYCTSYNLLEILMKYNLLNVAALRELPAVIRNLREVTDNYAYFSNKSINIVVNMAVSILDIAADVMSPNGELVGAGTYIFRKTINRNISRSALYDFVLNIERVRKEIYANNADLFENK